ncbi:MAG: hypothetical protein HKN93_05775 [Acidimicrobiia bacterium]|nr:hypothetical protein [Acidimicrobiia bacterium]
MLRASARISDRQVDLRGAAHLSIDPLLDGGREIVDFTTALVGRADVAASREAAVGAIGAEATARVAAVAGNFEMMNRILDAVGVPVPRSRAESIAGELGIDVDHFGHGPGPG